MEMGPKLVWTLVTRSKVRPVGPELEGPRSSLGAELLAPSLVLVVAESELMSPPSLGPFLGLTSCEVVPYLDRVD